MKVTMFLAPFFMFLACSSPTGKALVDAAATGDEATIGDEVVIEENDFSDHGDEPPEEGNLSEDEPFLPDGIVADELPEGDTFLPDDDTAAVKECVENNSPEAVAARDGFIEVCAIPLKYPLSVCGDGSPYKFTYRPAKGTSQGLLLYFRGGGYCTDYLSCWGKDGKGGSGRRVATMGNDLNTAPAVLPQTGETIGIFSLNETLNPLRDYDQVHLSYCTGDAGLRSEMVVLERPADADADAPESIATYFHGQYNLLFALDKAQDLFPNPARIVMFGSSAGSYAALSAVPMVDARWSDPQIPITYFSEGGMGVGMAPIDQAALDTITAYDGTGGARLIRFAQFSFISDEMQRGFAPAAYQDPATFQNGMRDLFEARAAASPGNYRYFSLDGTCHTLAQNVGLFQQFTNASGSWKPVIPAVKPNPDLAQNGINLVDWMTAVFTENPFDQSPENIAGDFTTIATTCPVPTGGM